METRLKTSSPRTVASPAEPRSALARSIGLAAFVYGYPLLETMRTCRLQTDTVHGDTSPVRAPIDQPLHWAGPTQASDRDIVTSANDFVHQRLGALGGRAALADRAGR